MRGAPKPVFYAVLVLLPAAAIALAVEAILPRIAPAPRLAYHAWGNRPDTLLPGVEHRAVTRNYDVVFRTNALGFKDEEHAVEKPPGVYRVLLLGDSFVEGQGVDPRDHLARVLERLAARDGVRLEAIAMAASGWGQSQELATYEVVGRRYAPDFVAVFFCANDLWNNFATQRTSRGPRPAYALGPDGRLVFELADEPETPPAPEALRRYERPPRSEGVRALRRLFARAFRIATAGEEERRAARLAALYELPPEADRAMRDPGGPPGVPRDRRILFEALVAALHRAVVARDGARLVNVHVTGYLDKPMDPDFARLLAWVAERYARHGVETVDLERVFRARVAAGDPYPAWRSDPHWNAAGHAYAAEALWGRIRALRAAPPGAPSRRAHGAARRDASRRRGQTPIQSVPQETGGGPGRQRAAGVGAPCGGAPAAGSPGAGPSPAGAGAPSSCASAGSASSSSIS